MPMNTNGLPTISIVTVVRNDAEGLSKSLRSLSSLRYPSLQYIVIDGASTDGTLEVIGANRRLINCWISEPDKGLYDAMNKGIRLASGEYLHFLNAGDVFASPSSLLDTVSTCSGQGALPFANVCLEHDTRVWKVPAGVRNGIVPTNYIPHHQSILYPRSFFESNYYDLTFRVMADADFTIRALRQLRPEYHNVDLVKSTLGGFTFKTYQTWRGTIGLYRERRELHRRHFPHLRGLKLAWANSAPCLKGIAVQCGGHSLATLLMQAKQRVGWLRQGVPRLPDRREP